MTLLSVIKDVCSTVGVKQPPSVFSGIAGDRTMQEMLSLANEMAQRIAYDSRDWTRLITSVAQPGSGNVNVGHPLPANFKRLLLTSNVRRLSTPDTPMRFIPDYEEWTKRGFSNTSSPNGEWIIIGNDMFTRPAIATDDHLHYAYLDKNCISLNSSGYGDAFTDDLDNFRLDERVLKLGMIWQWKAQKGTPYAEDMGTYGDALTYAMGHDSPAPIIIGRSPSSAYNRLAYPWATP